MGVLAFRLSSAQSLKCETFYSCTTSTLCAVPTTALDVPASANYNWSARNYSQTEYRHPCLKVLRLRTDLPQIQGSRPYCSVRSISVFHFIWLVSQEYFQMKRKIFRVTVLFKSGDPNNASNYRPILVLPVFSKGLEKYYSLAYRNFSMLIICYQMPNLV